MLLSSTGIKFEKIFYKKPSKKIFAFLKVGICWKNLRIFKFFVIERHVFKSYNALKIYLYDVKNQSEYKLK